MALQPTIKDLLAKIGEQECLIDRLQDRVSDYKDSLGHEAELADLWYKRALSLGWREHKALVREIMAGANK